ncbi:hypothetical protein SKAU_G00085120 [Synaphobranchus kaupii]|uniref:G-protein coupled receptors family 1 profile domain-containing protein n=1 Tax=Synaphobranchus kaupii TaxID=118154 RepID=A0A9Q1FV92_SYNKA|nr:hypothetical protein SKAU_G00085120 [Synaphobranchus kaupii]
MDIRKFFSVANKTENDVSPEKTGEVAGAVLQSPEIVSEKDEGRVLNLPPPLPTCYTETVSEDEGRPPPPACTPSTDCTAAKVPSDLGSEIEDGRMAESSQFTRCLLELPKVTVNDVRRIARMCTQTLQSKLEKGFKFYVSFYLCNYEVSNIGVLVLIITEKGLHQPMYLLFCNLSVNDVFGNTVLMPRLMSDVVSPERYISYSQCVLQAFCSHTFGSASHMILIIMALDRYVAICHPLRYPSIMTTSTVVKLSASAWGTSLLLVSILLGLTIRLSRCRSTILNAYCDNASLFKLSCEDVTINNIYGLFFLVVLFAASMGSIAVTYFTIAIICWSRKSKELNSKALQTCASHLVLYLIMLWTGFLTIILHRFPNYPDLRKLAYILFHVVPANLNPIIYGLQTKSLRNKITQIFTMKVTQS